jgi:hypothetical protein
LLKLRHGDGVDDVYVQTFDTTGATEADSPFHRYAACNQEIEDGAI